MKGINKAIFLYSLSIIFFTGLSIFLVIYFTNNYIKNSIRNIYEEKNFMIDLEPKIDKYLEVLDDTDGINIKTNHVYVTNNGETRNYQIRLESVNENENDIRINLDDYLIRSLSKFKKDNDEYILYEGTLKKGISALHKIGMWQSNKENKDSIKVNFKLKVKIFDE